MICPELPSAALPGSMAPCARQIESLRAQGLSVDVVDVRGLPKLKYLQVLPRIRLLAQQADVVHAHFGYCGWLGRMALSFSGSRAPLVVSFMGDDLLGTPCNDAGDLTRFSRLMVRTNRVLARLASQVIVKSREMADVIAPTPSSVIPNGVDLNTFLPIGRESARQEMNLPPTRKVVLFPGDPSNPRKGHKLASAAVDVAARLLSRPIDLVPLWGVEPQRVSILMNACDVMLMTSLIEGSPNVVKEAMACNVPIIGVRVGDVAQMLENVSGCSVCERDPQEIGEQLAASLSHPSSVDGRELLLQRGLGLESIARRVIGVYERALDRDTRRRSPQLIDRPAAAGLCSEKLGTDQETELAGRTSHRRVHSRDDRRPRVDGMTNATDF